MTNPISVHAVILAGGHGLRMPPLVSPERPKALLSIANRPMLFYSLYALYRARISNVTIVIDRLFHDPVSKYIESDFLNDPALVNYGQTRPALNIRIHSRAESADTADALRELEIVENDVFILSCDTLIDCHFESILQHHRASNSACTVSFAQLSLPSSAQQQQSSSKQSKSSKSSSASSSYTPQLYALVNDQSRLLAMLHPTDLESSTAIIRHTLLKRYDHLSFLSNVQDPHIYCFHSGALRHVLKYCPAISSVRFDLLPYIARRQHTLWRVADRALWSLPTDDFIVSMCILPSSTYAIRANTVPSFRTANADIAAGKLFSWLTLSNDSALSSTTAQQSQQQTKKKDKKDKKAKPPIPFSPAGEQVSVTPDCVVGTGCSAGDRTSVKKSVVGHNCVLGSNVKLNGCVLLSNVHVNDGANLTATVVCDNTVIGSSCILKECRVAAGTTVEDETEAADRGFGGEEENIAVGLAEGLGDEIEFV